MPKAAAQKTTGNTRIKGPTIISLYGAASAGKEGTLGGVAPVGTGYDKGLSIHIPTAQTAQALTIEQPDGTVIAGIDASGGLLNGNSKVSSRVTRYALTAANIQGMYAAPITIVAAPGTGKAIAVRRIVVELNLTATQFASGGVVHFYYHGSTTEIMAQTIAAATVNGGAGQTILILEPVQTAGGSVVTKEVGIDITNATGAFTTGTGTAVVTVYHDVITLG